MDDDALKLFALLEKEFSSLENHFDGVRIGWHCHLTALTYPAVKTLTNCGAQVFLSECNPSTSDKEAIALMEACGAKVFCGSGSERKVLEENIRVFSDTGAALFSNYLENPMPSIIAGCEITGSGIDRLRQMPLIPIPMININDNLLKARIENHHGVGLGIVEVLEKLGRVVPAFSGKNIVVFGYGQVGSGIASHLKERGTSVAIVESDPLRRLLAHFDGFSTAAHISSFPFSEIIITATGQPNVITAQDLSGLPDNLALVNAGHFPHEIDLDGIKKISVNCQKLGAEIDCYQYASSKECGEKGSLKSVYVACQGNPANIVMLTGPDVATYIHLATELLTMEYLLKNAAGLSNTLHSVPAGVLTRVSRLSLQVLVDRPVNSK